MNLIEVRKAKTIISENIKNDLINRGYQNFNLDILTSGDIQIKNHDFGGYNWNIALVSPKENKTFLLIINYDMNDTKNIICNNKNDLYKELDKYFSYHLSNNDIFISWDDMGENTFIGTKSEIQEYKNNLENIMLLSDFDIQNCIEDIQKLCKDKNNIDIVVEYNNICLYDKNILFAQWDFTTENINNNILIKLYKEISKLNFDVKFINDNIDLLYIENFKNVIESDTKDLYIKELNNHKNDNIKPLNNKEKDNNIISLSILNDDRKIIKSSLDKVYNIIDKDTKVDICIFDLNLQLRVLNESIKDNKKIDKNKLIDDFSTIINNIEKSIDIFQDNKRRLKTFKKMYEDISNILDCSILEFKKVV